MSEMSTDQMTVDRKVVGDDTKVSNITDTSAIQTKPPYTQTRYIAAGDLVIIFLSRERPPLPLVVTSGQEMNNTYGAFRHDDMIGLPFGAKMASHNRRGFIHLLRPTPELWTLALPHRTQILYTPDMSFISAHLGLSPGARLIEAGTGSGSFSHYATRCVARKHAQSSGFGWKGEAKKPKGRNGNDRNRNAKEVKPEGDSREADELLTRGDGEEEEDEEQMSIKPSDEEEAAILKQLSAPPHSFVPPREGRVWSFEFHAGRAVKAWKEFEHHGLFPTLSLRHRNVCKKGFGLENLADAVFLDLPAPWDALTYAAQAMRRDVPTRICCFSPCVEQVLKTVAGLRKGVPASVSADGKEIDEVRWTDIETYECLNRTHLSIWTGPGTQYHTPSIDEAIERIRQVEQKKGKRREMQIQRAKQQRMEKLKEGETDSTQPVKEDDVEMSADTIGEKRKRSEDDEGKNEDLPSKVSSSIPPKSRDNKALQKTNVFSKPAAEMRGHTSYLTFATLLPRIVERQPDPTLEKEKEVQRRKQLNAEKAQKRKQASMAEPSTEE